MYAVRFGQQRKISWWWAAGARSERGASGSVLLWGENILIWKTGHGYSEADFLKDCLWWFDASRGGLVARREEAARMVCWKRALTHNFENLAYKTLVFVERGPINSFFCALPHRAWRDCGASVKLAALLDQCTVGRVQDLAGTVNFWWLLSSVPLCRMCK